MTKAAELAKMGEVLTNSQIGRKNIITNGAMQISQRSASATGVGATDNVYPSLDRYAVSLGATSAGRFTMSQSVVTDLNGFSNALKIDCTTADTSVAAGEALMIQHRIEGLSCQQIKASSTSTNAYTISFYAKSNASRAIVLESKHTEGTNQQISSLHTIGTSWARYTMTVPASSSTEIDNDNTTGITISFWIHAGTTYTGGTLNTTSLAATTQANRAAGIGSIFASTDNTLEITGLQLEVGSVATPFEHRSFGEELSLCKRYYERSGLGFPWQANSSTEIWVGVSFAVEKRAAPTMTIITTDAALRMFEFGLGDRNSDSTPSIASVYSQTKSFLARIGNFSGISAGDMGMSAGLVSDVTADIFQFDAELQEK